MDDDNNGLHKALEGVQEDVRQMQRDREADAAACTEQINEVADYNDSTSGELDQLKLNVTRMFRAMREEIDELREKIIDLEEVIYKDGERSVCKMCEQVHVAQDGEDAKG